MACEDRLIQAARIPEEVRNAACKRKKAKRLRLKVKAESNLCSDLSIFIDTQVAYGGVVDFNNAPEGGIFQWGSALWGAALRVGTGEVWIW